MDMSNPLLPKYQLIFRNAVYFLALPFTLFLYRYDYTLPNTCILIISCIVSSLFFFFLRQIVSIMQHMLGRKATLWRTTQSASGRDPVQRSFLY